MTIDGISKNLYSQLNVSQVNDVESKGIQNQITDAQQQLSKLSSNQELTEDEKKQMRQDVQKQIEDLNRELRQHQMELRRKQLEEQNQRKETAEKTASDKDVMTKTRSSQNEEKELGVEQAENKQTELSHKNMANVMFADMAENQAGAQKRVVVNLEADARTMKSEIRQDEMRGQGTERKEQELKQMEQKISNASRTQISILANADRNMEHNVSKDDTFADRQPMRENIDVATVAGAPQNHTENAINGYNAEKMFSDVSFLVQ